MSAPESLAIVERFIAAMRKGADGANVGRDDTIKVRVSDWHRLLDLADEAKAVVARAAGASS